MESHQNLHCKNWMMCLPLRCPESQEQCPHASTTEQHEHGTTNLPDRPPLRSGFFLKAPTLTMPPNTLRLQWVQVQIRTLRDHKYMTGHLELPAVCECKLKSAYCGRKIQTDRQIFLNFHKRSTCFNLNIVHYCTEGNMYLGIMLSTVDNDYTEGQNTRGDQTSVVRPLTKYLDNHLNETRKPQELHQQPTAGCSQSNYNPVPK